MRSIERAGFVPGEDVSHIARRRGVEFGKAGRYRLGLEQRELDRDALAEMLLRWCDRYPILSIEDPFAEDDDEGFERFTAAVGDRIQVIGDDYLVTSASRVAEAARRGSVNAALIKVNQAGTVSEAKAASDEDIAPASARSSPRVRARPRTRRSFILRLAGAPDSSRSVRSRVPSGWRNGTRPCASRRRSVRRRVLPGSMSCRCDGGRSSRSKRALDGEFDDEESCRSRAARSQSQSRMRAGFAFTKAFPMQRRRSGALRWPRPSRSPPGQGEADARVSAPIPCRVSCGTISTLAAPQRPRIASP